mmetsp:Transcript_9057/g.41183  ORF Transcript_9057/g.41183 Transcript_9057/m.41183 type:complete len:746 (-) Transcript_9057:32-2269(-)
MLKKYLLKTKMDRALWCVTTQNYERSRLELASEKLGAVAWSLGELVAALAEVARLEEGVKLGIDDVHAKVNVVVGDQAGKGVGDLGPRLVHGEADDDDGGDGTPDKSDGNPEVEVALVEDTAAGGSAATREEREARPDDDHDEGEAPAPLLNPLEVLLEDLGVGVLVVLERGESVIDELNASVEGAEVEVLGGHEGHGGVDETGGADGHDVTGEHGVVHAESVDVDLALEAGGSGDPGDETEDETGDGAADGAGGVRLVPGEHEGDGHDGGTDEDTHHEVDEAKGESNRIEDEGEETHEDTEEHNTVAGDAENVLAGGVGVDVLAVDVVGDERGHGDLLSGAGGDDGHEKHDGDGDGTALAHEVSSDGGGDETRAGLSGGHGEIESDGGETHGGREGEGDGEPDETTEEVALGGGAGLGRDGGLPVGLVNEDGTEVTHDVDDAEDHTTLGEHGEVGASLVLRDVAAVLLVGKTARAFGGGRSGEAVEQVVDVVRGADTLALVAGVDDENEGDEDGEDDRGVDVARKEGRLEAASHGVRDDTDGDEETSNGRGHTGERVHGGGATEDKHGRDDDVRHEAEDGEHLRDVGAPTGVDDLNDGVRVGRVALHLDGEHTEEKHLNGRAGGVPERARDAILIGDVGGLEEGSRPGPLGDDDGGGETGLNVAAGGVEVLGRDVDTTVALVGLQDEAGDEGEEDAKADHDSVAGGLGKHVRVPEEGFFASAHTGGGVDVVLGGRGIIACRHDA